MANKKDYIKFQDLKTKISNCQGANGKRCYECKYNPCEDKKRYLEIVQNQKEKGGK